MTTLNYVLNEHLTGPGPSEITVFTSDALQAIDGPKSACTKSAWHDLVLPLRSITTIRDKAEHDVRRRAWDRAFSTKGLTNGRGSD